MAPPTSSTVCTTELPQLPHQPSSFGVSGFTSGLACVALPALEGVSPTTEPSVLPFALVPGLRGLSSGSSSVG